MEQEELVTYQEYIDGQWKSVATKLAEELPLAVYVNGRELVTMLCTPEKLNALVVGYLRSEGFVDSVDDFTLMRVCIPDKLAEVTLKYELPPTPPKRILTSGCGSGTSFDLGADVKPLTSKISFSPEQIISAMRLMQRAPESQSETGSVRKGLHISALSDGDKIIVQAEDIGRHNTLDKIWGECMLNNIPTEDKILLTTGRISSEMLSKAAKMGVPVVASINSATRRAVTVGSELGITIVGHVRGTHLSVYSGAERIKTS